LTNHFRRTGNVNAFSDAVEALHQTQRLNRYYTDAYLLEAESYMEMLRKGIKYKGLGAEIISVLRKAERVNPISPFIKLKMARVYFEFDNPVAAREEALKALELEPEYTAALFFLQKKLGHFLGESEFAARITAIRKKAGDWGGAPNDYLFRLFEIPPEYSKLDQSTQNEKGDDHEL
jgi:tetratricopeptide (TPR) repeat protein